MPGTGRPDHKNPLESGHIWQAEAIGNDEGSLDAADAYIHSK